MYALGPALESGRPPPERAHDAVVDGEVVVDDVELGDLARALGLREDHAVRAGHTQLAPPGADGGGLRLCHAAEFYGTASPGALSASVVLSKRDRFGRSDITVAQALLVPAGCATARRPAVPRSGTSARHRARSQTATSSCFRERRRWPSEA